MRRRKVVHTSSPKWPTDVPTLHPPPFLRKPSKVLPQRFASSKQIGFIPLPLEIMERIPVDRDQLIPTSHALVATAKKLRATDDKRHPFWSQHPSPQMRLSIAALSSWPGDQNDHPMRKLPGDSGEYLSALHGIRILELRCIGTGPSVKKTSATASPRSAKSSQISSSRISSRHSAQRD